MLDKCPYEAYDTAEHGMARHGTEEALKYTRRQQTKGHKRNMKYDQKSVYYSRGIAQFRF